MPVQKSVRVGDHRVNLYLDPDRISHQQARQSLEAIQEADDVSQSTAAELALTRLYDAPPEEALEVLRARWDVSDAETVREALRRYPVEVDV